MPGRVNYVDAFPFPGSRLLAACIRPRSNGVVFGKDTEKPFVAVLSLTGRCRMIVAQNSHTGNVCQQNHTIMN